MRTLNVFISRTLLSFLLSVAKTKLFSNSLSCSQKLSLLLTSCCSWNVIVNWFLEIFIIFFYYFNLMVSWFYLLWFSKSKFQIWLSNSNFFIRLAISIFIKFENSSNEKSFEFDIASIKIRLGKIFYEKKKFQKMKN